MPLLFYMPFYDKMGTKESNGKEVVMVLYNGKKRLPSGIEDFEELISQDFYYVDKTKLIKDLLERMGKVNLFTRPRRFGKSLTLSMLYHFWSVNGKNELFEGLEISNEKQICQEHMGKYPVIFLSLKGVDGRNYESARMALSQIIFDTAMKFIELRNSEKLLDEEKAEYQRFFVRNAKGDPDLSQEVVENSLLVLTRLLYRQYGQKAVILIDEYDVPLDKAYNKGYYDDMLGCIRNMFHNAMKTNEALAFAVITGCLRVAKESIFTGLNNPKIFPFDDVRMTEYFGFTDEEVTEMLSYYDRMEQYETVRQWYDGYRFGTQDIYCPWDVICYCDILLDKEEVRPRNFWANTSSNDILRRLAERSDDKVLAEIRQLIAGESLKKTVNRELTYQEIEDSVDNIWSVMYMTGYLTAAGDTEGNELELRIPNTEIRNIFTETMENWFRTSVSTDGTTAEEFVMALLQKNPEKAQKILSRFLRKVISIRDTYVAKDKKENFYHGIILGLLGYKEGWVISSNKEAGEGYSDIFVGVEKDETAMILEIKYVEDEEDSDLEEGCKKALVQIKEKDYEDAAAGYVEVIKFGIACRRKRCMIRMENDKKD